MSESFIHDSSEADEPERGDDHIVSVARGDSFLDDGEEDGLESVLPSVTDEQWTQFVRSMMVATLSAVSASNALGMFEITPRRLADLGVVKKLARRKNNQGRTIWVAVFVPPLTCSKFLKSPQSQYAVFSKSMCDYANRIDNGELEKDPEMPLSGALVILHKCGPSGLSTWASGDRFPATQAAFDRVSGVF